MCGIYLALSKRQHIHPSDKHAEALRNRGPDSVRELTLTIPVRERDVDKQADANPASQVDLVYVTCMSTVLSLRGQQIITQPVVASFAKHTDDINSFLCWNGEAWTVAGAPVRGNDSEQVSRILAHVSQSYSAFAADTHEQGIAQALAVIGGPYAFAFYDPHVRRLYFGRDFLGRRSLVFRRIDNGDIVISSTTDAETEGWHEVEADGIYWVDMDAMPSNGQVEFGWIAYYSGQDELPNGRQFTVRPLSLKQKPTSQTDDHPTRLSSTSAAVFTLERLLRHSLALRVRTIPHPPMPVGAEGSTRLAVLFSGGLDCTVLARLAHDALGPEESIDLLNVAFHNPRVHKQDQSGSIGAAKSPYELCPDRITGRASFAELQQICPSRHWRFVAIDVPYTETLAHRSTLMSLMRPHNTEMDLSIACALYFAARGSGIVNGPDDLARPYTTPARVLLSGLGADELFAGYTRHATAFSRKGTIGLLGELELDIARLGKRNLGRDDRVISTWAREVRFPFLDETLVNWALQLPISQKCGFGEPSIYAAHAADSAALDPSKKVLRCLAWKLGMCKVANEKKRAVSQMSYYALRQLTSTRSNLGLGQPKWKPVEARVPTSSSDPLSSIVM